MNNDDKTKPATAAEPAAASTPARAVNKPVKTPRTTQPRPTDKAARAAWKKSRAQALGDLPAD